jgi:ATP-dependent DNA helicase RecQ
MLRAWRFDERPTWVTSVPSTSRPHLVSEFARRVADRLELPYIDAIRRVSDRPPQKTRNNGCQQARNVLGAFEIGRIRPGPVLLIDDTVDSRWTFTMAGHHLRAAGSGPVFPVALADTAGAGG